MSSGATEASGLVLAQAQTRPDQAAQQAGPGLRWLLLSEDYPRLLRWREAIGRTGGEVVAAGPLVSAAAERLRRPFLDLMTDLGRRHDSLAWWSSRISERNTVVNSLFLYCCYLAAAEAELDPGSVCVVCDSWGVLESLEEIARRREIPYRWVASRPVIPHRVGASARAISRLSRFIARQLLQRLSAPPRIDPSTLRGPVILARTWPDTTSFGADGSFHDRYFPGLDAWLGAQGATTVTIPVLSNLPGSYRSAWQRLLATSRRFLAPESYYRPSDYLFAVREAARAAGMPNAPTLRIDGLEVSRLFAAERRQRLFDPGSLEALLSSRLPLRLAAAGLEPELVIDPFENMIPEKALVLGIRRYLPGTKIVGFQHGALYPLLLCNFITHGESEFAPMPDRVVCNGELFRRILVDEGLPEERAVVGPSLRYAHLWETSSSQDRPGAGTAVLIPLPLTLAEAVELLVKVSTAYADDDRFQVRLKPHPMSQPEPFWREAGIDRLPSNFTRVGGPMSTALADAGVVVGIASSSLYEALAAGRPVVVVGRDAALDLNPLAWHEDLRKVFSEPDRIRAETLRLLSLPAEELAVYRKRTERVLRSSFNPVTPAAMHTFIDGMIDLSGAGQPTLAAGSGS